MSVGDRSRLRLARRVVVKVGSSSISGARASQLEPLVDAIAEFRRGGSEVVLVTSGAISTGMPFLGLPERPHDLATQQAAAAVGQNILINRYQARLHQHNLVAGQVLLTSADFDAPVSRANAGHALERLLELGVVPIINENDTVATDEIRFGDNDRLAALVCGLLGADALLLLSDVDAIYTGPPEQADSEPILEVAPADSLTEVQFGSIPSGTLGTGGARTKVAAAKLARDSGAVVLVTATHRIADVLAGAEIGTWFHAVSD